MYYHIFYAIILIEKISLQAIKQTVIRHGEAFLNISPHEWGRVAPAFLIKLLAHVAIVSGSTILLVHFLGEYDIEQLPRLFIIQSLFVILGTTLLTGIFKRHPLNLSIVIGSLAAAFFLLLTGKFAEGSLPYFLVALLGLSVFLTQVNIWISLYIEDLFSPLEGERVLPVVESAEPIGGIAAGVMMVSLIGVIPIDLMLLAVGGVLLAIPLLLLAFMGNLRSMPVLRIRDHRLHKTKALNMPDIKNVIYKSHFLFGLFTVVFLQFFVFHFVEFQYTKKMDEVARHHTVSYQEPIEPLPAEFTVAPVSSHSERLMHDLGAFQIAIHALLFFVQLLLTASALQRLGVMRSFALGPILSFCSFLSLIFGHNLGSALGTKGVYEIANGMSKSAFGNAFYALPEKIRSEAKEILEGVARPLGLLAGTICLLILQQILSDHAMMLTITTILIVASAFASLIAYGLARHYTHLSKKKFETAESMPEKLNAVEILSQKGHHHAREYLMERLADTAEARDIRIKILQVMGRLQKTDLIPQILLCCHDTDAAIRLAAVEALANYRHLGNKFFSQAFSRYSILTSLKELFLTSKDKKVKLAAIKVFANLDDPEIIPFLVKNLKTADPELRAEAISVCGAFRDPGTIAHIEPFLKDKSAKVVAAAIVALWQFVPLRVQLVVKMARLLDSKNPDTVICGIDAAGDTGSLQEKRRLEKLLDHKNERISRHAIIALAKMNEFHVVDHLVGFMFHPEKQVGLATKKLIGGLQPKYRRAIEKRVLHEAGRKVTAILKEAGTSVLEYLPTPALEELVHLFTLIDAEHELWSVKMLLAERQEGIKAAVA